MESTGEHGVESTGEDRVRAQGRTEWGQGAQQGKEQGVQGSSVVGPWQKTG